MLASAREPTPEEIATAEARLDAAVADNDAGAVQKARQPLEIGPKAKRWRISHLPRKPHRPDVAGRVAGRLSPTGRPAAESLPASRIVTGRLQSEL